MSHRRGTILRWAAAATACAALAGGGTVRAQDEAPKKPLKLPEIPAYEVSQEGFLLYTMRVEKSYFEYLRGIRKLEPVPSSKDLPPPVLPEILKGASTAIGTELSYFESDWFNHEDLETAAQLLHRMDKTLGDLFGKTRTKKRQYLLTHTEEAYYKLVDELAGEHEATRKVARRVVSLPVGDFRIAHEPTPARVFSIVATDLVINWSPEAFAVPTPLREGLQVYLSIILSGEFHYFVSIKETTPIAGRGGQVGGLVAMAREVLSRPKGEDFEALLRSDNNAINFSRLSVLVALVDYLLRYHRDRFPEFIRVLEKEGHDGEKLKGPEGIHEAQKKAFTEAFGVSLPDLEVKLKAFVARNYLLEEELAKAVGLDRESSDSIFSGFERVCELKREGKPVSEKGERIFKELSERLNSKLASKKVPF